MDVSNNIVRSYTTGLGVLASDLLTNRPRNNFIGGNDVAGSDQHDCVEVTIGDFGAVIPVPTLANTWYHNRGPLDPLPAGICR